MLWERPYGPAFSGLSDMRQPRRTPFTMNDKRTTITLPGEFGARLSDYGRQHPEYMIAQFRLYALDMKRLAEKILDASDESFHVETHAGVYKRKNVVILQEGKKQ